MAAQASVVFAKGGLRDRIDAFFANLGQGMSAYAQHRSRADQVRALNAKSDAELSKMGITRDDIPRYVFRDLFYV
ncbi:DUF1127 domain-containing protein [Thalassobius vesicularis]|uniref:DUF1127 domain-containing protein n=1 Tax=Thalassobius vesicularis TaxID=1294297 RepID=A0A4S3MAN3_9RHOB|nr:DUF1127 domain-containing protein [Thalassobius vesicularis]THD75643.1 DUF1127 domain-containing protein [Thalassobius vesicularis]